MPNRALKDYFVITLKGVAMGAADVVPGVSGGTIAFISGIYDELLDSINTINLDLFRTIKNEGFSKAWEKMNGNFLLALGSGILLSILSLAKILSWLLINQPVLVWSFFFGLVLASIFFVAKQIKGWNLWIVVSLITGILIAFYITQISPKEVPNPSYLYLVLCGALAICAMILPGISGSFILVLLGVYGLVLNAVHQMNGTVIFFVAMGAILGLGSFSRLLKYVLNHYRNITLAVLTGFIIGSLNKIWPWKKILETRMVEGKELIIKDQSILPTQYDGNPQLFWAVLLAVIGFLLIVLLEKWAQQHTQNP